MLIKYENDLITYDNTEVYHEDIFIYNASNYFEVIPGNPEITGPVCTVNFQRGPIKEYGVNGAFNEDLIAMVLCRLEHFQKTEFSCRENAVAITKLEEALMWLRKRTLNRMKRGVLNTYNK